MKLNEKVLLNGINKMLHFNNVVKKYDLEAYIVSGGFILNAKSLFNIFILDCSVPLEVIIYEDPKDEIDSLRTEISDYIV